MSDKHKIAIILFVKKHVRANSKEIIKALLYGLFMWEIHQ